jgi:hypothetical protein
MEALAGSGAGASSHPGDVMTSTDLILRCLDEIERKLDRIMEELRPQQPSAIQHAGAIVQRRTDVARATSS